MEFFVWLLFIAIGLAILLIPLALAVAGLALIVNAVQKIFYRE
jgi:hypothetical protein